MRIVYHQDLKDFEFWGGAKETVKLLHCAELFDLQMYFETEDVGMTDYDLNDFFWFETDWIAKYLGYEDFEELYNERSK